MLAYIHCVLWLAGLQNHVQVGKDGKLTRCHLEFNPADKSLISKVNTQCAEEANSWLGRYKWSVRHMNECSFPFFMTCIIEEHNEMNVRRQSLDAFLNPDRYEKKNKTAPASAAASEAP